MKSTVIRTAIVASLLTALAVTAIGLYAMPKMLNPNVPADQAATMQPAVYDTQASSDTTAPVLRTRPRPRRVYSDDPTYPVAQQTTAQNTIYRDSSGEPVVRHGRSTRDSVLIVAGSAGTGAAIGALAGGGKGAAIGALAGGAGGFIYDRLTHNH